jgi:hypothetical protein
VAHACNPSYKRGIGRKISETSLSRPCLKCGPSGRECLPRNTIPWVQITRMKKLSSVTLFLIICVNPENILKYVNIYTLFKWKRAHFRTHFDLKICFCLYFLTEISSFYSSTIMNVVLFQTPSIVFTVFRVVFKYLLVDTAMDEWNGEEQRL